MEGQIQSLAKSVAVLAQEVRTIKGGPKPAPSLTPGFVQQSLDPMSGLILAGNLATTPVQVGGSSGSSMMPPRGSLLGSPPSPGVLGPTPSMAPHLQGELLQLDGGVGSSGKSGLTMRGSESMALLNSEQVLDPWARIAWFEHQIRTDCGAYFDHQPWSLEVHARARAAGLGGKHRTLAKMLVSTARAYELSRM